MFFFIASGPTAQISGGNRSGYSYHERGIWVRESPRNLSPIPSVPSNVTISACLPCSKIPVLVPFRARKTNNICLVTFFKIETFTAHKWPAATCKYLYYLALKASL